METPAKTIDLAHAMGRRAGRHAAEICHSYGWSTKDCTPPSLSGEWADSMTPATLCELVNVDPADDLAEAVCDAWESGVAEIWHEAF